MENNDVRAAADAMIAVIRRIEAMPGSWPSLTDEMAATVRGLLSQHSDPLKTFLSLPSGHIEMRTVDVGTPFGVIRAARGFEPDDDPYVVIIGPSPGTDRAVVAVLDAAARRTVGADQRGDGV
jgi:hypothetical protein